MRPFIALALFCLTLAPQLRAQSTAPTPDAKILASFQAASPFTTGALIREFPSDRIWPTSQGKIVPNPADPTTNALQVSDAALFLQGPMDWRGYDFLQIKILNTDSRPQPFVIEAQDPTSTSYWEQIIRPTMLLPGPNIVMLPLDHIRHGGKSRPKLPADLAHITLLALKISSPPDHPAYLTRIALTTETEFPKLFFDGLRAFDLGPANSPVMKGFRPLDPSMQYTPQRGYGLKNAQLYNPKGFDGFQPDPLYRDWLCIEHGGIAVDLPNGQYHVVLNIDNPSGYWGEYQYYRNRKVLAQGKVVVDESMDFTALKQKYFRHFADEDLPADDIFAKYVAPMFHEKTFVVEVADGQLNLEFNSKAFGCSVSSLIIYPVAKSQQGAAFLQALEAKRKWYFNNDFEKVPRPNPVSNFTPNDAERNRGLVLFHRDFMTDVFYNDKPVYELAAAAQGQEPDQPCKQLATTAFPGQSVPLEFSLLPLRDLGQVTVTTTDLKGSALIPAANLEIGYISYRLAPTDYHGTSCGIKPKLVMPYNNVACPANITRRFWLRLAVPPNTPPGAYAATLTLTFADGKKIPLPLTLNVLHGALDAMDIPVGPFGHTIALPWFADDPQTKAWNAQMRLKSLHKLLDAGFTACSGIPAISFQGFGPDRQPILDFSLADEQMKLFTQLGFKMPFITYGAEFRGLALDHQDLPAMQKAGFTDYSQFIKAIFSAVQSHAQAHNWLGCYWCLGDEPAGADAVNATLLNLQSYRQAFPQGPPYFTFCGSYTEKDPTDPPFRLARAAHLACWNLHTENSVNLLRSQGGEWAFYNGGNRWTFGDYMYKCAKQFDMKFRACWHWNIAAGDPYYGLDCREDDFCWCNSSPDGDLIPSLYFERLREGLTDYRALLTLQRLAKEYPNKPESQAAQQLIDRRLASFHLNDRDHDTLFPPSDFPQFRQKIFTLIDTLSPRP